MNKTERFGCLFRFSFFWLLMCPENLCFPTGEDDGLSSVPVALSRHSFRGVLPFKSIRPRFPRAENGGGIGEFFQNVAQDGISSTSAFSSPTVIVGGFSMMVQPMPNGTEFAGQLMNALPHYTGFLPSLPGFPGLRQGEMTEKEGDSKS